MSTQTEAKRENTIYITKESLNLKSHLNSSTIKPFLNPNYNSIFAPSIRGALFVLYGNLMLAHLSSQIQKQAENIPNSRLKAEDLRRKAKNLKPPNQKPFYTPDPDNAGVGTRYKLKFYEGGNPYR